MSVVRNNHLIVSHMLFSQDGATIATTCVRHVWWTKWAGEPILKQGEGFKVLSSNVQSKEGDHQFDFVGKRSSMAAHNTNCNGLVTTSLPIFFKKATCVWRVAKIHLALSISIVHMLGWCKGVSNHRSVGSMIPFSASGGGSIPRVGEAFCELEVGQPKIFPKKTLTSLVYRSTWHWRRWPRSWVVAKERVPVTNSTGTTSGKDTSRPVHLKAMWGGVGRLRAKGQDVNLEFFK